MNPVIVDDGIYKLFVVPHPKVAATNTSASRVGSTDRPTRREQFAGSLS